MALESPKHLWRIMKRLVELLCGICMSGHTPEHILILKRSNFHSPLQRNGCYWIISTEQQSLQCAQMRAESSPGSISCILIDGQFCSKKVNKRVNFYKRTAQPSGCGQFLSLQCAIWGYGHDLCLHCLGHVHNKTVFVYGSCSHSESMSIWILWSWRSYFSQRLRASTADSCPGPSTSKYEALVANTEGDLPEHALKAALS